MGDQRRLRHASRLGRAHRSHPRRLPGAGGDHGLSRLDLADGLRILHRAGGGEYFGHPGHLRFGWELLEEAGDAAEAERVACLTIRHVTEMGGTPSKYHATVTMFWIRMLHHFRVLTPEASSVEELIELHPSLADPELPRRHWSDLDSDVARVSWVEPDLTPLP